MCVSCISVDFSSNKQSPAMYVSANQKMVITRLWKDWLRGNGNVVVSVREGLGMEMGNACLLLRGFRLGLNEWKKE